MVKRTLVISNACFSDEGSNGRTLKNLFAGMDADRLAQFFIYGEPDFRVCKKYYQVSDKDALRSLIFSKRAGGPVGDGKKKGDGKHDITDWGMKKTPMKVLVREIVWLFGRWRTKRLWKWMDAFAPEIIFVFIANNTFLIRLARETARRYKIPIVVYSTEAYNFMNYNYLTKRFSVIYNIYYAWLSKEFKKITASVEKGFFNSTFLRDRYALEYGYPCCCVMNSSRIEWIDHSETKGKGTVRIAYLGNLGLGRHKALIEVADALREIDHKLYLDIYGPIPNGTVKRELEEAAGIRLHGLILYEKVVEVIHKCDLLVHVELNDAVINRELKYAFSTKIADCVCSGTPLLIYANEGLAETMFLEENGCAFVAHDKKGLKKALRQALTNEDARKKIIQNAKITRDKYLTDNGKFIKTFMR